VGSTSTGSRRGQLAALATVALWCSSFALIKHLVDAGLAAQDVAVGRFVVAWPGFIYLLWRAGGLPGLTRGEALRILVASAGGVTAYHLARNEGERTTASGVAALIVALAPAATLALSLAVGLERFAPRRIAGITLAFAGVVVVVVLGSGADFSLHGLRGPLLVLVAPLTFAVYNVLYKPLLGRYDLPALTAAGGWWARCCSCRSRTSVRSTGSAPSTRAAGSRWPPSVWVPRWAATSPGASLCGGSSPRAPCPTSTASRRWPWRSARSSWTSRSRSGCCSAARS
jgi:EamA-like transporter family